jgi:hypothetical protein
MKAGGIGSAFLCAALVLGAGAAGAASSEPRPALTAALASAVAQIEKKLPEIRGRGFKTPVPLETMGEDSVRGFLLKKLEEEYPDARIAEEQKTYQHFGFLKRGDDLKSLFIDMLTSQAAGFYDQDRKRLFLVEGKPFPGIALVHEMAHALQDQNFDVGRILEGARDNDDALRAAQAMIEGEAMALSSLYMSLRPEQPAVFEGLDALAGGKERLQESLDALHSYPDMLQADLMFPYTQGMSWAEAVNRIGGAALMDQMFRRPPESTEQILHPEKIQSPRDVPSIIDRKILPDLKQAGYDTVKVNTWGEFCVRQLLGGAGDQGAGDAATGWDGDLYAVYEKAGAGTAMIWVSAWDSAEDAAEFRSRAVQWLRGRHADGVGFRSGAGEGRVARVVYLVEGFPEPMADELEAGLRGSLAARVTLR